MSLNTKNLTDRVRYKVRSQAPERCRQIVATKIELDNDKYIICMPNGEYECECGYDLMIPKWLVNESDEESLIDSLTNHFVNHIMTLTQWSISIVVVYYSLDDIIVQDGFYSIRYYMND